MNCPKLVALLGCDCPELTKAIVKLSSFWNIVHVSYDRGTMSLNSNDINANFFRTYPSDEHLVTIIRAVVRYYGWKKVHLITQDEALFTDTTSALRLSWVNTTQQFNETLIKSPGMMTPDLFPPETRVFVLSMNPLNARRVMCYAVQQNAAGVDPSHYYVQYVWITLGWYPQQWWTRAVTPDSQYTDTFTVCSDAALEAMLHWALAINHRPQPLDTTGKTDVNYKLIAGSGTSKYFFQTSVAPFAYDAVFALAFALNNSIQLANISNGVNLTTYLRTEMLKLNFTGVSGPVAFDSNGTRIQTSLQVYQYRRHVGSVVCGTASPEGSFERVAIGTVTDGTFKYITYGSPRIIYTIVALPLFVAYTILTSLGILFGVVCALFNIIFRKTKIVRLTSPNLNYFIVLGVILMYISVYLYCISTDNTTVMYIVARIRLWTQIIGFSLCFGTILAKVWRVYYIFHNPSAVKKKPPLDWQLLLFVMSLVVVDITYLIVITFLDDYSPTLELDKEHRATRGEDYILNSFMYIKAEGKHEKVWKIVIYVYKALLQATACILAFRTRKVHIKVLNDAKYITAIIYTTSILLAISIVGVLTLKQYPNTFAAVFSTCLLIVCTLVLALLFIPKMVILYKDPKGENIFERTNTLSQLSAMKGSVIELDRERMLEKRVQDLERRLRKYEAVEPMSPCDTLHSSVNGSRIHLNVVVHPTADTMNTKPVESPCNDLELSGSSSNSPCDGEIKKTALENGHFESECGDTIKKMKVSFSEDESLSVTIGNHEHQCSRDT
eukprot:Em0023g248a